MDSTLSRGIRRWARGSVSMLPTPFHSDWSRHRWCESVSQFRDLLELLGKRCSLFCKGCSTINMWIWGSQRPSCLSNGRTWQRKKTRPPKSRPENGARWSPDGIIWVPRPSCVWGQANPWNLKFWANGPFPTSPASLSWVLTFACGKVLTNTGTSFHKEIRK